MFRLKLVEKMFFLVGQTKRNQILTNQSIVYSDQLIGNEGCCFLILYFKNKSWIKS